MSLNISMRAHAIALSSGIQSNPVDSSFTLRGIDLIVLKRRVSGLPFVPFYAVHRQYNVICTDDLDE
jgi:hypothetical protein